MAMFEIKQAGPLVTIQDKGRAGNMRYGVSPSGPMDRMAFQFAHIGLNQKSTKAIEISVGGLSLSCIDGAVSACIAGGAFSVVLDGQEIPPWSTFTLTPGCTLTVRPGAWGSWCYLAFAGDLNAPEWLNSASTVMGSDVCGAPLRVGGRIEVLKSKVISDQTTEILNPSALKPCQDIRVVLGPQDRFFTSQAIEDLQSKSFFMTADYNRQGVRLEGPKLDISAPLDMPSEPIARGSLQVSGAGDPFCLLADHQTTGGYPKIATVISADQDKLVQMRPGYGVKFQTVDVQTANRAAHETQAMREELRKSVTHSRMSLDQKLWASNLVSGVIDDHRD